MRLEDGHRYIVNVGSVGQPRDRDPRSCYIIYDTDKQHVDFLRVEYDVAAAQEKIMRAGLPPQLATRLAIGV
jgi:diadenosine tetraphosphatase ApaH/serine/threonine PP2A family protein phosphatase